jgi:hypothetical protein
VQRKKAAVVVMAANMAAVMAANMVDGMAVNMADGMANIMMDGMIEDGEETTGELVFGDIQVIMTMVIDTKIIITAIISRPLMATGTILAILITIIPINKVVSSIRHLASPTLGAFF